MQKVGFGSLLPPWISRLLTCMGGCFGGFSKPSTIIAFGEPSKGFRQRDQTTGKSNTSDNFWSSSAGEMDNSAQLSFSSISTLNQPLDPCSNTGSTSTSTSTSTSNPSAFVNHGLLLWNQMRQQWIGSKRSDNKLQLREATISWNATYESLLGTNKCFPQPVPLAEMVDFLVDVWEQEGFYD